LEHNAIFLGSLDSQEKRAIVSTNANAAYAEPGYLLYLRDKTLVAQPFDLKHFALNGEPHTLSDKVMYFPGVDKAVFSVANRDVLATQTGTGASVSQLTWFDRTGKSLGVAGVPENYGNVRLSPDGHRIVADKTDPSGRNIDLWVGEPARGATTRLTFDPALDQTPIWSPDGKQMLFASSRDVGFHLYVKNSNGSGAEEKVADLGAGMQMNAWDWSRDGKYILFGKDTELWSLSWPERVAKPLLQAKWTLKNAQFSPDGRWIAYATNETGNMEVYVSPFPTGNGKWQVSNAGGEEPRWRKDGKELFYLSPEGKMMAVAVKTGTSFEAGGPVALFQAHRRQTHSSGAVFSYDVTGDGERFVIITKADEPAAAPLSVVLNWATEMEK
jgi:Tol biopolymer transport system component